MSVTHFNISKTKKNNYICTANHRKVATLFLRWISECSLLTERLILIYVSKLHSESHPKRSCLLVADYLYRMILK